MGIFDRHLDCPPFGRLTAQGQSSVWEGTIDLPHLGVGFALRVHGRREGPMPEQVAAFARVLADGERIRAQATPALVAYLRECEVVPDEIALCDANLWSHLDPCWIEVHGGDDANACSIHYEIPWDEQCASLRLIDGRLDEICAEG
ncbi:MAG: hypothetical protein KF903_08780 [Dokdonella sp.]|uniref:hypothetical protein n=1 Tax=Dokdonella sp. TaxID=2291710 RepID=UPI0025C1CE2F|nr:hypothetical protein [Dokdonella sp.]MBX3701075.1 hypothetical protein [Dokdonella sp.]